MKLAAIGFETAADFSDCLADIFLIGEVDLDVIFRTGRPGAIVGKILSRAGDDAPPGPRKTLHRRMADATAGTGQDQSFTFGIRLGSIGTGNVCFGDLGHGNLALQS